MSSERLRGEFLAAIRQASRQAKRAILDLVDLQDETLQRTAHFAPDFWATLKRQVHNDVAVVEHRIVLAFEQAERQEPVAFCTVVSGQVARASESLRAFLATARPDFPDTRAFRRIARHVSRTLCALEDQVVAAFVIYAAGGVIPQFGRSPEEIRTAWQSRMQRLARSGRRPP